MVRRPIVALLAALICSGWLTLRAAEGPIPGFTVTRDAAIAGYNDRHLVDVTPEACAAACVAAREFECRSFDYYKRERQCDLSANDATDVGLAPQGPGSRYDHYARNDLPEAWLAAFRSTPDAFLEGYDRQRLTGVSPNECARACISAIDFMCRSFDYDREARACDLSDAHAVGASLTRGQPGRAHYARAEVERLDDFRVVRNAAIAGHNNRHLSSVTPEDCARACREERTFLCRSFDYYRQSRRCNLSSETEASAGLRRDVAEHPYDYYEPRAGWGHVPGASPAD